MADASSDSWIADVYRLPAHKKWVPKKRGKKSLPGPLPPMKSQTVAVVCARQKVASMY